MGAKKNHKILYRKAKKAKEALIAATAHPDKAHFYAVITACAQERMALVPMGLRTIDFDNDREFETNAAKRELAHGKNVFTCSNCPGNA